MANTSTLNTPILWINKYIQSKIANSQDIALPMFTPGPGTIDQLTETFFTIDGTNVPTAGVTLTWDRLHRLGRKAFPHIKGEQVLYYLIAREENAIENVISISEEIFRLMDRGDETAQEVNAWTANRKIDLGDGNAPVDCMFFFHRFKVYQLEEVADIIDFGTARTFGGNKIIIEFDYHQSQDILNQYAPEAKKLNKTVI